MQHRLPIYALVYQLLVVLTFFSRSYSFRDLDNNYFFVAQLENGLEPDEVAEVFGLISLGPVGELEDYFAFSTFKAKLNHPDDLVSTVNNPGRSLSSKHKRVAKRVKQFETQSVSKIFKRKMFPFPTNFLKKGFVRLHDRFFGVEKGINRQWHILNKEHPGSDLNVIPVWEENVTGANVTICLIDDGIEHLTNFANYQKKGSYDFNTHSPDPVPKLNDDQHGTRCAGEIVSTKDVHCGVGVAYGATLSGVRALSGPLIGFDEATAISYKNSINDIYSCSWGPTDDGKTIGEPQGITRKSIEHAIANGRQGKGSIYVFASGNGGYNKDNCNFDGYANSIYTIAVGAIDHLDQHPAYSEGCSGLMVVTYSGGDDGKNGIYTTDTKGKCTDEHSGTSAAAPLVSGVLALVLQVRPDLTWRDIQHLLVREAVPISIYDPSWSVTYSGRQFSNIFGYGKIDAHKIVTAARAFKTVNPQRELTVTPTISSEAIPEGYPYLVIPIKVTADMINESQFGTVEHVAIKLTIQHKYRNDVEVDLVSPNKVWSNLIQARPLDDSGHGFDDWTVTSLKHWDEPPMGEWQLIVRDVNPGNNATGTLEKVTATFYGQQDPSIKLKHHYVPFKKIKNSMRSLLGSILSFF